MQINAAPLMRGGWGYNNSENASCRKCTKDNLIIDGISILTFLQNKQCLCHMVFFANSKSNGTDIHL